MSEIVCFQGSVGAGKTTRLIELADRYFSYVVAPEMMYSVL